MSARPRTRRLRRLGMRLLLVLVALLLAVLAIELFVHLPILSDPLWLQMRGTVEEHPPGQLRTVAGYRGTQTIGGGRQLVRHNLVGMRGPDHPAKVPGEQRVLFVGDSVTYGTGVDEADTFALQTGVLLTRARGRPVTAGIAACPGLGSTDHADLLRRAAGHFAPDLVVSCVFVENDLYDNLSLERAVVAGYPLFHGPQVRLARGSLRARLMLQLKTAWLVEQALSRWLPALALDPTPLQPTPAERSRWDGVAPDQSLLFLEQTGEVAAVRRLLDIAAGGLAELRAAAGPVPVAVVLIPSYVQYVPGLFEHHAAARTGEGPARRGTIQARLMTVCADQGVPCRDLLPDLLEHPAPLELLIANDFHFTAAGHRFVAEKLAPWLANLLP